MLGQLRKAGTSRSGRDIDSRMYFHGGGSNGTTDELDPLNCVSCHSRIKVLELGRQPHVDTEDPYVSSTDKRLQLDMVCAAAKTTTKRRRTRFREPIVFAKPDHCFLLQSIEVHCFAVKDSALSPKVDNLPFTNQPYRLHDSH